MRPKLKLINPAEFLPLWEVSGSNIVTTRGCYLKAIRLRGIDSEHQAGDQLLSIAGALYRDLVSHIPEQTVFQFILRGTSDHSDVFGAYQRIPAPEHPVLALQRQRRLEFLAGANLRRHEIYLFVGSTDGLLGKEFGRISPESHLKKVAALEDLSTRTLSTLQNAGLDCRLMEEEEIFDLYWQMLNPDPGFRRLPFERRHELLSKEELKYNRSLRARTIREYLVQSNFGPWSAEHLLIGGYYHEVLTLRDLPGSTEFTLAEAFYGFEFDSWVSFNLMIPRQGRYRSSLDQQRRFANADRGRGGNIEDYTRKERYEEGEDLAELLAKTGQRLVLLGAQAVIRAASVEELNHRKRIFLDRMRTKGIGWFSENGAHDREFWKTLPGLGVAHDRHLLITSNNSVDLLPLFEEDRGDRDPVLLVKTRRGELFSFNPFEEARDNWNATVFGASGSGKSVFMNLLIASAALANKTKGRLMVIDFAGEQKSSYLMLAKLLGGDYVPILSTSGQYSINPFPEPGRAMQDGEVAGTTLAFLIVITDILLANTGTDKDAQLFRVIIQNAIRDTYARAGDRAPIYGDLFNTLKTYVGRRDVDQERLGVVLKLLGSFLEGPFSRLFNRATTATTKSPFLILDLFGIESLEAHIASAVVFLATQWVKEIAFDPKDSGFKYIVLDEVAQLIRRQEMVSLIDELYSTSRKHRTSVWTVTQSYSTYRQSALAATVKLNSTTNIFLSHASDAAGRRVIAEDYQLRSRDQVLFDSLTTVKGRFSEALIRTECVDGKTGTKRPVTTVLRVELSPFDYQICTSDPVDREVQRNFIETNPDIPLHEVLEHIAKLKGRGE